MSESLDATHASKIDTVVEGATQEEVDKAEAIVTGDPYLASDPLTEQVLENDGIMEVEGVRRKVDLQNFLEARRSILAYKHVSSIDPVALKVAQEAHELDKGRSLH